MWSCARRIHVTYIGGVVTHQLPGIGAVQNVGTAYIILRAPSILAQAFKHGHQAQDQCSI